LEEILRLLLVYSEINLLPEVLSSGMQLRQLLLCSVATLKLNLFLEVLQLRSHLEILRISQHYSEEQLLPPAVFSEGQHNRRQACSAELNQQVASFHSLTQTPASLA
jgi:hypothetical protein